VLESAIERKVVHDAAKKWGVYSIKLNGPGSRGWPDRLYILPGGRVRFHEYKSPTGRLSPIQKHIHEVMATKGHYVQVFSDANRALEDLEAELLC